MTGLDAALIFLAGLGAGAINTVVGSGSLITFPTLLALGYPPVAANVSNNVGLVPGAVAGAFGYRRELAGQRGRLIRLGAASMAGALAGGGLLLGLPPEAFRVIVPVLIAMALVLVMIQPWVSRWVLERGRTRRPHGGPLLWVAVCAASVYGGYFGAAQGIILIALLGMFIDDALQRINATKIVLAGVVNATAALLFIAFAPIEWTVVLIIAVGSTAGGFLGAALGRRLPPVVLRGVIVVVGLAAIVNLLTG